MRVLFISNLFPDKTEPWRGLDNATLLQALKREAPDLTVQALALRPTLLRRSQARHARQQDEWTSPIFIPVPYVPKFGGINDRLASRALSKGLVRHGIDPGTFDVLLTPWLFPDACAVHRIAMPRRLPQVAIAQGSDVHRYLEMPMRRRAILRFASETGGIVTRSRDLATRLTNAGAPKTKVHPIYNGVDTHCFSGGAKREAREMLALPADGQIGLFVGNFLPVKGIELLLEAVAQVCAEGANFHLALIGSGPLQQELQSLVVELGIKDRIHWRGRLDPVGVASHMRAADAVCLSSHNEGVPNVVLEAMASGRPVITTDVGGIHEVLGPKSELHGLVKTRDKGDYARVLASMLHSLPDEFEIKAYGSTFSWSNCARHHLQLMESLVSSGT